jgi:hypothetical protein
MNKSSIPVAQKEALGMLIDDHRKAKKLFKEFESEKDSEKKEGMAREVCMQLTVHTRLEEEYFYPALREQDPDAFDDLLNEATVEHASAKELIAQIEGSGPSDPLWEAKVTVLGEYVNHHVEEEENEMFTLVIDKKIDLREIAQSMAQRKEELLATTA